MNRIVYIILMLLAVQAVEAKVKVVDKSSRRVPEWYNGAAQESIIVSSVSEISVEDAKRRVMEQVKMKVIESIAENVNYTAMSVIVQNNGDNESFSDEFSSSLMLNSANVPFISGISESKIEDFYWEITEDRETKRRNYIYSVKYPLLQSEVDSFIRKFEENDAKKVEQLEQLAGGYRSVSSVDEIADAIAECEELDEYFFDGARRANVAAVKSKYSSLYSRVAVVTTSEELGRATIALQIGEKSLATTRMPSVRYDREMILNLKVTPNDGGFEVSYDPQFCEVGMPYVITLMVPVGMRTISHEITFTQEADVETSIEQQGLVTLTAHNVDDDCVANLQLSLDLAVSGLPDATPIYIDMVTLKTLLLQDEIYCETLTAKYISDGVVEVEGKVDTIMVRSGAKSSATIKILSGEVSGCYGEERIPFQTKFNRGFECNW